MGELRTFTPSDIVESFRDVVTAPVEFQSPTVLRDARGRIHWKKSGNTDEENLQIGIRNIQALFLKKFPEFTALFPFGEDEKIIEGKRESARDFILVKIGKTEDFEALTKSTLNKGVAPYFQGSHKVAMGKSFEPWGVVFTFDESSSKELCDLTGRYHWKDFRRQPQEVIMRAIEEEAQKYLDSGIALTDQSLNENKRSGFLAGIRKYYPGGLLALSKKLDVQRREYKPKGYWDDPINIERETEGLIAAGVNITSINMKRLGKSSYWAAIFNNYPGGLHALRRKFNLSWSQRVNGYWDNPENIERETEEFLRATGDINTSKMERKGKSSLAWAIRRKYPGGLVALKEKFGLIQNNAVSSEKVREEMDRLFEME